MSCFKILATSRLRLTEVTGLTMHATSNRDVDMEFTTKISTGTSQGILVPLVFLLCLFDILDDNRARLAMCSS